MASSGVAKWGLPAPEHTLLIGTPTEVPEVVDRGHVVVVVGAMVVVVVPATVVVVCCPPVVVGTVDAVPLQAAATSPTVEIATALRIR
jgi:hypothetical protein